MKKSFMTRALATGLSLAMAFSLSAATNVTVASAASTPAMASKQFAVRVGGATKTYKASAATLKKFKITKATVGNSSKATVAVAASKKGIKVTPGTVTGSTVVKVTFRNTATKKSTTKKYRCVVKAEKKPVEEAYKITSASVTGVKTITVELNKAVVNTATVTATVKKGSTTKDSKLAVDGSKIVITTDTKLSAGTYNVTIGGVAETDLTAEVTAEKDETLTSYEVGAELIADADSSTKGSIYYKALNQYGEMMTANAPEATCSFSSVKPVVAVTATAEREGRIDVTDINTALAILGTKGTVVLVDQNLGVNATATVTYSAPATAANVEIAGMYNTSKSAFQDITAGDNANEYFLLVNIADQYGHQLNFKKIEKDVSVTIAGGITNLVNDTSVNSGAEAAKGMKDFTIGGKDYIAIVLKDNGSGVKAGSATLTMVNNKRGLLLTHTIDVLEYVILSNFVVSADNGIYNNQDNEITYEATDKESKAVTNFAVLRKLVALPYGWAWQKNADGSAKLIFHPTANITSNKSHTGSTIVPAVFYCNEPTSTSYMVKTQNFTVRQAREVIGVQGLASDAVTQFSSTLGEMKLDFNKIVYVDQYANKVTKDDKIYPGTSIVTTSAATTPDTCGVKIETSTGMVATVSGSAFEFTSTTKSATATIYLKYYNTIANDGTDPVSSDKYDYRFVVTCVDTQGVAASSVKISKVNGGYTEYVKAASSSALEASNIDVIATVGGVDTKLASTQYIIKAIDNGSFTIEEQNKGTKTKTATVTIQVTTFDNDNNPTVTELKADYQISYADPYAFEIKDVSAAGKGYMNAAATGAAFQVTGNKLSATDMQTFYEFKDQYGKAFTPSKADSHVKYSITPKDTTLVKVYGENTTDVYATAEVPGMYKLTISATPDNGKTTTKDFYVNFQ